MTSISTLKVSPLAEDLPFGAAVEGVDLDALRDPALRDQLKELFEDRGVIVFKNMAPDNELHLTLSEVFGPLQHHPLYVDDDVKPTVIDLNQKQDVIRANGKLLAAFLPWHFDACYTAKLNRAAILRPIELPPEGGWTGFADGVQLYKAISPKLRAELEDAKILYHAKLMFMNQKFGFPTDHEWVSVSDPALDSIKRSETARRSVHPAIWERPSGERVLHVSPWQASGIYGNEGSEGDALISALCGRNLREDDTLLASLGDVGHGAVGQLALHPCGEWQRSPICSPSAAGHHRRRLWPGLLRAGAWTEPSPQ